MRINYIDISEKDWVNVIINIIVFPFTLII